jgi:hypothetical protein
MRLSEPTFRGRLAGAGSHKSPQKSVCTALLCAIGHANFHSGRCDAKQSTMARETGFSREYIKRALNWREDHTGFLRIQQRPGHSNAYHVQWKTTDAAWAEIQAKLKRGGCEL